MRHALSPRCEDLEGRMLLSARAHHAAAPKAQVPVVTTPLVVQGTLAVAQKAASSSTDGSGDTITTVPVTGELTGIGKVRGLWNESEDAYGNYIGPDTIQLRSAQGTFSVVFNDTHLGKAHRTATGASFNPVPQHVHGGTGAYAHATETGTIVLNTNATRKVIESLALNTTG